jgi:hypothetical protein
MSGFGLETFVMSALGVFGTLIIQKIKYYSGASGNKALTLSVAVSIALAAIGAVATGSFMGVDGAITPYSVFVGTTNVFTVATLAYKYLSSNNG